MAVLFLFLSGTGSSALQDLTLLLYNTEFRTYGKQYSSADVGEFCLPSDAGSYRGVKIWRYHIHGVTARKIAEVGC